MRVEVDLSQDDFRAFTRAILFSSASGIRFWLPLLWMALVAFVVGFVHSFVSTLTGFRFNLDLSSAVLPFLLFLGVLFYFLQRLQRSALPTESGSILGRHTYDFTDTGIMEASDHTQNFRRGDCRSKALEGRDGPNRPCWMVPGNGDERGNPAYAFRIDA